MVALRPPTTGPVLFPDGAGWTPGLQIHGAKATLVCNTHAELPYSALPNSFLRHSRKRPGACSNVVMAKPEDLQAFVVHEHGDISVSDPTPALGRGQPLASSPWERAPNPQMGADYEIKVELDGQPVPAAPKYDAATGIWSAETAPVPLVAGPDNALRVLAMRTAGGAGLRANAIFGKVEITGASEGAAASVVIRTDDNAASGDHVDFTIQGARPDDTLDLGEGATTYRALAGRHVYIEGEVAKHTDLRGHVYATDRVVGLTVPADVPTDVF